jgi:hypothetical protein
MRLKPAAALYESDKNENASKTRQSHSPNARRAARATSQVPAAQRASLGAFVRTPLMMVLLRTLSA